MNSFDGRADLPACVVTEHWWESTVVVSCSGVLDMLTAPHLEQRMDAVLDKQPTALIVDLTDVDFLASHGMNVLVTVHGRIHSEVAFSVVADGPATSRPLTLVGLAGVLNLCSTMDGALQKLGIDTFT